MPRKVLIPLLIMGALALCACAPIETPAAAQPDAAAQPEPIVIERAGDVPRISVDEAKAHIDNGTAIFVDSRSLASYDVEHIVGAIPLPYGEPVELGDTIPKEQLIIGYCT